MQDEQADVVALLNNPEGRELVQEVCSERGFSYSAFLELIQAEVSHAQKRVLWGKFDDVLDRIKVGED